MAEKYLALIYHDGVLRRVTVCKRHSSAKGLKTKFEKTFPRVKVQLFPVALIEEMMKGVIPKREHFRVLQQIM